MKKFKLRSIIFRLLVVCVSLLTLLSFNSKSGRVLADEVSSDTFETNTSESLEKFDTETPQNSDFNTSNSDGVPSGQNSKFAYNVPGELPAIAQPTTMSCWSAGAAKMVSWKKGASYTIEQVMDMAGEYYRRKFDSSDPKKQGLYPSEEKQFFASLGMKTEAPKNYTAQGILSLLQNYGPIFVTGNEGSTSSPMIHVRIITGIFGDGTPDGTKLKISDPDGGQNYIESFRNFALKYEDVANVDTNGGFDLRLQIAHF